MTSWICIGKKKKRFAFFHLGKKKKVIRHLDNLALFNKLAVLVDVDDLLTNDGLPDLVVLDFDDALLNEDRVEFLFFFF